MARIYGVERIEHRNGKKVYTLAFIYEGNDLGKMHRFGQRHEVAEGDLTWDKRPALLGVVNDPADFGFDPATVERLVKTGLVMAARGYRAKPNKRVRGVVVGRR